MGTLGKTNAPSPRGRRTSLNIVDTNLRNAELHIIDTPPYRKTTVPVSSVSQSDYKDICLVVRHNLVFAIQQMQRLKRTSVVPYLKEKSPKDDEKFIWRVCSRYVWIAISRRDTKDASYVEFVRKIIERKQLESGKDNTSKYTYGVKGLLLDDLQSRDLPPELKELRVLKFKENGQNNLAEVLEGQPSKDVIHIQRAILNENKGPFLRVHIILVLQADGSSAYLKRAYETMKEVLDDSTSYPRQHFLHLYKMPNVRVLEDKCKADGNRVCVELRPNHIRDVLKFLKAQKEGCVADILRDSLKVNSQPFIGIVYVDIERSDVQYVLTRLLPAAQEHVNLRTILQDGHWDRLEKLAEPLIPYEGVIIPKLKGLAATVLYETHVTCHEKTPYAYLNMVKRSGCPPMLDLIRSQKGYSAMHLAIIHERSDFLKMIFYQNSWEYLRQLPVEPYAVDPGVDRMVHVGYTPRRLAEAMSFKTKGFDMFRDFDKYDSIWLRLSPLPRACLAGRLDYVSKIVDHQPDQLHKKDSNGSNCLFYACTSGNASLVEYLIKKAVPRNVWNNDDESVLHISAILGLTDVLKVLGKFHFDIRGKRNKHGYCAVDFCAMSGDVETLKLYKEMKFPIGSKALTVAVKNKQQAVIEYLLTAEVKTREITTFDINRGRDKDERLAIHYAAITGNDRTMKLLLENGANISTEDKFHKNVLHLSADHEQMHILELILNTATKASLDELLQSHDIFIGKDLVYIVRGKDRGRKAWHWVELRRLCVQAFKSAMASGQIDVSSYGRILKSGFGPGPDSQTTKAMEERTQTRLKPDDGKPLIEDMTPLHIATLKNNEAIVIKLLSAGADPNAVDYIKATPMHYAAMLGNTKIMSLLENKGGRLDAVTNDGKQPMDVAEENSQAAVINFIKAKTMMKWAEDFIAKPLQTTHKQLAVESLQDKREKGEDLRVHLIDTLRDLSIKINMFLKELGSGPVQEASKDSGTSAVDRVAFPHPVTGAGAAQADIDD